MKSLLFRLLPFLAAAAISLSLTACDTAPAGADDTSADTAAETTAAPAADLTLFADGATQYTIVRSEMGSKSETETAIMVRKYLEACGAKPKITTDWEGNPVSDYEIVIGDTTRGVDAGIDIHDLGEEGYTIRAVGTRIFVVGGTAEATQTAAEKFLTDFFGYTGDVSVGTSLTTVTVPAGYDDTSRQTFALEQLTVNGTDLREYVIVSADKTTEDLAETVQNAFYTRCGIWMDIVETAVAGHSIVFLDEAASTENSFELAVEQGNIVLRTDLTFGHERGFYSFMDEIVGEAAGTLALAADYKYVSEIGNYVTYGQFGAVGDGVTDDFAAILEAHTFANANNMEVRADEGATYYIGRRTETAEIQTNVDWTGASFIIDDSVMEVSLRQTHTFHISRKDTKGIDLKKLGVTSLTKGQEKITLSEALPGDCYVYVDDANTKNFIREGSNQNNGSTQTDCFILRADGTVDPTTPIIWDFDRITTITAFPLEEETLTVKGGTITTIANQAPSEYTYYTTGIEVIRSNVVIDGLTHYIEGEGSHGAPYDAIIQVNKCANVTIQNCTFTAHRIYLTIGSAGTSVSMGSYDLRCNRAINVLYKDCDQTTDILDGKYWGLFCSDYCKNLTLDGCTFSRFDAHMGVTNATIRNSTLGHQGLNAIGHGLLTIENTTIYGGNFINLRGDYGSTWNGDLVIRNSTWIPNSGKGTGAQISLIGGSYSGMHDFGYDCYMPQNITIDGLHIQEGKASALYDGIYLLGNITPAWTNAAYEKKVRTQGYPYNVTKTITVKNFTSDLNKKWKLSVNEYMYRDVVVTDLDA